MLTEKVIKEIEQATGISGLQEMINSQEQHEPVLKKTKHFADLDYDILVKNLQGSGDAKKSYEEGKEAGSEITVKNIKKSLGLDFEGKDTNKLIENIQKTIEVSKEGDLKNVSDEYEKQLNALKKTVVDKENELKEILTKQKRSKIDNTVNRQFDSMEINVPSYITDEEQIKAYIKLEREKNKLLFLQQYNLDLDDNENIIPLKDGNILRDELQNPMRVDKLISDFAKSSFMNLKQPEIKGRGEGDRLPQRVAEFKSMNDVNKYAEEKGIRRNTAEFDALVIEFNKNKQ